MTRASAAGLSHPVPIDPPSPPPVVVVRPTPLVAVAEVIVVLGLAWGASRGLHLATPGLDLLAVATVLLAARSGFWVGAGAGLVASLLLLGEAHRQPADFLSLTLDRAVLPATLAPLALGAVVGWIADSHLSRQATLLLQKRAQEAEYAALSARYEVVTKAKEVLDRRAVGQIQTISAVYEAAKELESLEPKAIWNATARLAARFLEAEAISVYAIEGFRLRLVSTHGDRPDRPILLSVQDGLVGEVARLGQSLGARDKVAYQQGGVLLAAAMKVPGQPVRGVIAVEQIPFTHLTPTARQLLDLIAEWSCRSLQTSEAVAQALAEQMFDPVTRLPHVTLLERRLHQEWSLAKRYNVPLSAMLIRKPDLLNWPGPQRTTEALPLVRLLQREIREEDVLGHYRTDDSFLVLLPQTSREQAETLATRLKQAHGDLVFAVASLEDGPDTPEVLLQVLQLLAFDLDEA